MKEIIETNVNNTERTKVEITNKKNCKKKINVTRIRRSRK